MIKLRFVDGERDVWEIRTDGRIFALALASQPTAAAELEQGSKTLPLLDGVEDSLGSAGRLPKIGLLSPL